MECHTQVPRHGIAEGESAELYATFAGGSVAAADHESEGEMAGGAGIWCADISHDRDKSADYDAWIV